MDQHDLLPIGEVSARSGVTVPTVRFYEERGLIESVRNVGNHRRYPRHTLRRLAVVRAGQRFGLSLGEIGEAMTAVRDGLADCIGCGCLSMTSCPIYNADDVHASEGPGARRWPAAARE